MLSLDNIEVAELEQEQQETVIAQVPPEQVADTTTPEQQRDIIDRSTQLSAGGFSIVKLPSLPI